MGVGAGRREDPLPRPLAPGSRILDAQRPRELDPPRPIRQISLVLPPDLGEMMQQWTLETLEEHGDAVAIPFAPRTVQHGTDEPGGAWHTVKNRAYLLAREHYRHPRRPHQRLEPATLGLGAHIGTQCAAAKVAFRTTAPWGSGVS